MCLGTGLLCSCFNSANSLLCSANSSSSNANLFSAFIHLRPSSLCSVSKFLPYQSSHSTLKEFPPRRKIALNKLFKQIVYRKMMNLMI